MRHKHKKPQNKKKKMTIPEKRNDLMRKTINHEKLQKFSDKI